MNHAERQQGHEISRDVLHGRILYADVSVFNRCLIGGRFGGLFVLLVVVSVVTLSAQTKRTFTNPRPEPYFKTLFPNAGGFSTFGGEPLHYKVYGVDPKTNPAAAADRLHLLDHRRGAEGGGLSRPDSFPRRHGHARHDPGRGDGLQLRAVRLLLRRSAEVRRAVQEQEHSRSVPGRQGHRRRVARLDHDEPRRPRGARLRRGRWPRPS